MNKSFKNPFENRMSTKCSFAYFYDRKLPHNHTNTLKERLVHNSREKKCFDIVFIFTRGCMNICRQYSNIKQHLLVCLYYSK